MKFRCSIDVTGFASVLIALLAMFIARPTDDRDVRPVELARARHAIEMPGADREDALLVAVQRDGKIFFDRELVDAEELPTKIKAGLKRGRPPEVYLRIDERARYHIIAKALDGIRSSGVEKIGIVTDRSFNPAVDQKTR